jgi:hypothetical protein
VNLGALVGVLLCVAMLGLGGLLIAKADAIDESTKMRLLYLPARQTGSLLVLLGLISLFFAVWGMVITWK